MKNLFILLGLALLTSCMSFSDRPLRPVRNAIAQQMPRISLEKEFAVSFRGGIFDLLDIVTFNEADLSEIDHVQLAVYKVYPDGIKIDFDTLDFEAMMLAKDSSLHWEIIIRVREEDKQVWVLVGINLDRNALEAVTLFTLHNNELVLINIDGDLDQMIVVPCSLLTDTEESSSRARWPLQRDVSLSLSYGG